MTKTTLISAAAAALSLSGCADSSAVTSSNVDPVSFAAAPVGAAPGTCWGQDRQPCRGRDGQTQNTSGTRANQQRRPRTGSAGLQD